MQMYTFAPMRNTFAVLGVLVLAASAYAVPGVQDERVINQVDEFTLEHGTEATVISVARMEPLAGVIPTTIVVPGANYPAGDIEPVSSALVVISVPVAHSSGGMPG